MPYSNPCWPVGALALLSFSACSPRPVDPGVAAPASARQHWIDVITLAISVTALCAATGAVRSSLLSLYAIPARRHRRRVRQLVARRVALRTVVGALGAVPGSLTANTYIGDPEFLTLLFNTFAPAVRRGVAGRCVDREDAE